MIRPLAALAVLGCATVAMAQSTPLPDDDPAVQFEVVSIKKNDTAAPGGSGRTMPDGSSIMINQPIRGILGGASPVPVREVLGLPGWVTADRYDITMKPPAGAERGQRGAMLRNMLRERMKFAAHVEEREETTFALVLARPDGKLGPELKPSTLDCGPRPPGTPPPPPRTTAPTFDEMRGTCGMMAGNGRIVSGGMLLDSFAQSLGNMAGGFATNKTGLTGFYALSLTYTPPGNRATDNPDPSAPPDLFTAVQEQLGLKLVPEKSKVPVLIVDHIEPPTPN